MKKYYAPELKVVNLNIQNVIAASTYEGDNPIPVIRPDEAVKDQLDFVEDISSDLFGNETFGSAEEW